MQIHQSSQDRIYEIRGQRVMLDRELANLYEVETKAINQAVKRNGKRFPEDFMFQLTRTEWESVRLKVETSNDKVDSLRSQIVTLDTGGRGQHSKYLPYAFTEQGVAMLSGVLSSDRAIKMNIAIMRAFVAVRQVIIEQSDIKEQLRLIQERMTDHDVQLSQIYDSIENLLDDKASERKWENRERIGFKK